MSEVEVIDRHTALVRMPVSEARLRGIRPPIPGDTVTLESKSGPFARFEVLRVDWQGEDLLMYCRAEEEQG